MIELKDAGIAAVAAAASAILTRLIDNWRRYAKDKGDFSLRSWQELVRAQEEIRASLNADIKGLKADLDRAWERVHELELELEGVRKENVQLRAQLALSEARVSELERCQDCAGRDYVCAREPVRSAAVHRDNADLAREDTGAPREGGE